MNTKFWLFVVLVLGLIFLCPSESRATPFTSTQSGSWNNPATWGGGGFPGCNDSATIANGHTVTLTSDIGGLSCNISFTINNGGTLDLAGNEINWSGNNQTFTNNGTFTNSGPTLKRLFSANGGANFTLAGTGIYGANVQLENVSTNWHISAGATFTWPTAANNANFLIDHPASLILDGDLILNGPTTGTSYAIFDKPSGAVVTGTGIVKTQGNVRLKFANMDRLVETVSGNAQGEGLFRAGWKIDTGASLKLSAPMTVDNQSAGSGMNIQSGATLDLAGNQLDIGFNGPFTNNGLVINTGAFALIRFSGNGTHTISGAGAYNTNAGIEIVDNVTTIAAGSSLTFTAPAPLSPSFEKLAVSPANILVDAAATLNVNGPGNITLSRGVQNNGVMTVNAGGASCAVSSRIVIRSSAAGTQRPWDGNPISMINADVKDQAGLASITVTGGLTSGNNGANWNFVNICTTAATATVSGRVLADLNGRGVTNARVTLTDQDGISRTVVTGRSGRYLFENVETGRVYTIVVFSRRYNFIPRVVSVFDNLTDVDFVPEE